jgi:predicted AAA+ superfamily ATPase
MTKFRPREISHLLTAALKNMPATVISGMRQTGKSTLLNHVFPPSKYYSFDDYNVLAAAKRDPEDLGLNVINPNYAIEAAFEKKNLEPKW